MSQFDVFELADGIWVVDVQSDLIQPFATRFVIPLVAEDEDAAPVSRLNPVLTVGGQRRLLATHLAGAVSRRALSRPIGSLADQDLTIKTALDMLISGY